MSTIIRHLKNNDGDANVSKALHIAIVFVVGAILLIMMTSSFQGPIHGWLSGTVADWFHFGPPQTGWVHNGTILPLYPDEYNSWGYDYYMVFELDGQIGYYGFQSNELFADTEYGTFGFRNDVNASLYIFDNGQWTFLQHNKESAGRNPDNQSLGGLNIIASNFDLYDQNGNMYRGQNELEKYYDPVE
jgi:hypothetical protein